MCPNHKSPHQSKVIQLCDLPVGTSGMIHAISNLSNENDFTLRLAHLGLFAGESLTLVRKAPWFKDPVVISFKDCHLALTKEEAESIAIVVEE